MSFKFEKLSIWEKAMNLGEEMNELASKLPTHERFNLSDQTRRASDSIALNIAEGAILQSNKEQRRFLGYALRSLAEVVTCLYKLMNRNYIDASYFKEKYDFCYHLMNMIIAYRKKFDSI